MSSNTPSENPSILRKINARQTDLGGFSVGRVLPYVHQRMIGPWIFFDHMGPAEFDPGIGINVRPHPHIHLATVTYLFEGEIFHRDSLGNALPIRPGDINLMIAGTGITHSERETEIRKAQKRRMNGLQLWMALPEASQDVAPEFIHYPQKDIPATSVNDVPVRVMIGNAYGLESPVKTFCETLYVEARMTANQSLILPTTTERGLYLVEGDVDINGSPLHQQQMVVLGDNPITVTAKKDSVISLIGGEPLGQRHMFWNFVSSDPQALENAKQRWAEGHFPKVPGDDVEFIPLPKA